MDRLDELAVFVAILDAGSLTVAARRLRRSAPAVTRGLAACGDALRPSADAAPHGMLRITAPLIFGRRHVTPVVASFLAVHPAMQAELLLADRNLDLVEEGLDVALRIGPPADHLPLPLLVGEV